MFRASERSREPTLPARPLNVFCVSSQLRIGTKRPKWRTRRRTAGVTVQNLSPSMPSGWRQHHQISVSKWTGLCMRGMAAAVPLERARAFCYPLPQFSRLHSGRRQGPLLVLIFSRRTRTVRANSRRIWDTRFIHLFSQLCRHRSPVALRNHLAPNLPSRRAPTCIPWNSSVQSQLPSEPNQIADQFSSIYIPGLTATLTDFPFAQSSCRQPRSLIRRSSQPLKR